MSEAHAHPNYVKVWVWLLILLAISIAGPILEVPWITIATAFGIAVIKTFIVAANFMHLKFEKRTLGMIALTPLVICTFLMFMLVPDLNRTPHQSLAHTADHSPSQ